MTFAPFELILRRVLGLERLPSLSLRRRIVMRLTSIIVCSVVLAGFVVSSPQTACAQAKDAEKQQTKKAEKEQAKKTEGVGEGKYVVWVYKMEDEQWVRQPERTLNTDDAKKANEYVDQVKAVEGWTASTNAPEPPAESVVGTWIGHGTGSDGAYTFEETYSPNGTCYEEIAGGIGKGTWRQSGNTVHRNYPESDAVAGGPSTGVIVNGVLTYRGTDTTGAFTETLTRKK
jgi:hypothetical protein